MWKAYVALSRNDAGMAPAQLIAGIRSGRRSVFAATLALQQGVNPKVVQEMLGHSSITLTLGTYSHVLPPMRREAADHLNALFADHEIQS